MAFSQRFVISHPDETAFRTGGLRNYSSYRELAWQRRRAGWPMRT
jgi:hypothetical protein